MNQDNLSLMIEALLKIIKKYSLIETSDEKYSIQLVKTRESTFGGRSYEILINEKWLSFESENDFLDIERN